MLCLIGTNQVLKATKFDSPPVFIEKGVKLSIRECQSFGFERNFPACFLDYSTKIVNGKNLKSINIIPTIRIHDYPYIWTIKENSYIRSLREHEEAEFIFSHFIIIKDYNAYLENIKMQMDLVHEQNCDSLFENLFAVFKHSLGNQRRTYDRRYEPLLTKKFEVGEKILNHCNDKDNLNQVQVARRKLIQFNNEIYKLLNKKQWEA